MSKTSKQAKTKNSTSEQVKWAQAPAEHDYPAAESFLRLSVEPELVEAAIAQLSQAVTVQQHAKDVLRAARLPLLDSSDPEVAKDLAKVAAGQALAPVLLIRGDITTGRLLQIADGYHRVCASYHLSEDTDIPCRLVSLPVLAI
jgi:DNA-binding transcriptional LysR family regulator